MRTAFILLKSPQEQSPGRAISSIASRDDAWVVLFEDAVYHAVREEMAEKLREVASEVMVASDDLEARGFRESDLKTGKAVGYEGIVETIMEGTDRTVTL